MYPHLRTKLRKKCIVNTHSLYPVSLQRKLLVVVAVVVVHTVMKSRRRAIIPGQCRGEPQEQTW